MAESSHPPIIAVFGGNNKSDIVITLAKDVGQAVTSHGAILLTGGFWQPGMLTKKNVKDAAIAGALTAIPKGKVARVIGIVPENPPKGKEPTRKDAAFELVQTPNSRCLFVHTKLRSSERNFINGLTPDVAIVLDGGPGTLAEVAFAAYAKIPVVFLNFLPISKALDSEFDKNLQETEAEYQKYDSKPLVVPARAALMALLNPQPKGLHAVMGFKIQDADQAVANAITLHKSGGKFPGISYDIPKSKSEFDRHLAIVAALSTIDQI